MSTTTLSSKLRQAVAAGLFDEDLCSSIEQLCRSNPESAESFIEKFNANIPDRLSERAIWSLSKVLLRFVGLFGEEKLSGWYPLLLNSLETRDSELVKCLGALAKELSLKSRGFEEELLSVYFSVEEPNEQILLLSLDPSRIKSFFANLNEYISVGSTHSVSDPHTCLRAIELLSLIAHKQGPNLNQIAETPTFQSLLAVMQETPYTAVMLGAVLALCMFIPWVLPSLPPLLPRLFAIIKRAICWDFTAAVNDLPVQSRSFKAPNSRPGSFSRTRASGEGDSARPLTSFLSLSTSPNTHHHISASPSSIRSSSQAPVSTRDVAHVRRAQSTPSPASSAASTSTSTVNQPHHFHIQLRDPHETFANTTPTKRSSVSESPGGETPKSPRSPEGPASPRSPTSGSSRSLSHLGSSAKNSIPLQLKELMRRASVVLLRLTQNLFPSSLLEYLRKEATEDEKFHSQVVPLLATLRWNAWILESNPGNELSTKRWKSVNPYQFLVDSVFGEYRTEVDKLWAANAALSSTTPLTSSHAAAATEIQLKAQILQLQTELGINSDASKAASALTSSSSSSSSSALETASSSTSPISSVGGDSDSGSNLLPLQRRELPSLDLASLGQTIMKLQNLLEKALYHQSTSKTMAPEELVLPTSTAELQTWATILRNQLLFEKFVRHQLQNRLISMQKDAVQVDQIVAEKVAMQAQLEHQQTVQDDLFKRWREQQDRINALQEQNRRTHENLSKQIQALQTTLNATTDERDALIESNASQRAEIESLKKQLIEAEDIALNAEAQMQTAAARSKMTAALEAQLRTVRNELLIWEENRRFMSQEREHLEDLKSKIQAQETLLAQSHRSHEQATSRANSISAKLEETIQRLNQAKSDNQDLKQRNHKLQLLFENQKQVAQSKISTVEDKYNTIRLLAQGYERQILDLRVELERLQYSSGTTSDPPSPSPSLSSSSSLALSK